MKLATVRNAAQELDVAEHILRAMIRAGKLPTMPLGNRQLVDVDEARAMLPTIRRGTSINEVSQRTGLSVSAIRRGIREGWMPCEKSGRAYVFDMEAVTAAIQQRMTKE